MSETVDGDTFYVDFERIREHDGYVYYWELVDFFKPTEYGDLSIMTHNRGDCRLLRYFGLGGVLHKERMGTGKGVVDNRPDKKWRYPSPESTTEHILKTVCAYAK